MHASPAHTMAKVSQPLVRMIEAFGIEGDAHAGATVKHRSRVKRDPAVPNLRQVHLIPAELHDELGAKGFTVAAGEMGENVTTRGVDLLGLPTGTHLRLGADTVLQVTGLRTPCGQLNGVSPGLMDELIDRDANGQIVGRRAGIMAVVVTGGEVQPGDPIEVRLPSEPHHPLLPV